jgi:hypothetical protein
VHHSIATGVGRLSPRVGEWLDGKRLQGGIWTALRVSELVSSRRAAFLAMTADVDHIVALSNWGMKLLLLNGVPAPKLSLARTGIKGYLIERMGRA